MNALMQRFVHDEGGQDIVEYALLAASIAVVAIPSVALLGAAVTTVFAAVADQLADG